MRLLFTSGIGILPEQRIQRWKMVSELYAALGEGFRKLGHQTYYYVHPEVVVDSIPDAQLWTCADQLHLGTVMEQFRPDFVFCWNGSSPGDVATSTLANAFRAKNVYSEQGWFPQKTTLYFDLAGCNAKCGTRNRSYPLLSEKQRQGFLGARAGYIKEAAVAHLFETDRFKVRLPDLTKPVFVPLQDERDLNIVQDSEFKTMDEFVAYLCKTYPQLRFLVRPHPKFRDVQLQARDNVEIDNSKKPLFDALAACGLVMGLNSTVLLESALLGYPVVSFAESLATGTGLFVDARRSSPKGPPPLDDVRIDSGRAEAVLAHLLQKQLPRDQLSDPVALLQSSIFRELREFTEWQTRF